MSENKDKQLSEETNYTSLGMSLGMLFGAALGVVIWLTTDLFVFFSCFHWCRYVCWPGNWGRER